MFITHNMFWNVNVTCTLLTLHDITNVTLTISSYPLFRNNIMIINLVCWSKLVDHQADPAELM